mmetsp:Transcript_26907/g.44339  ORF Transcript_26907/g.44339 Transcript_26907/m.44339 type:complete len:116 (+) Transcript_26907:359-706(+)
MSRLGSVPTSEDNGNAELSKTDESEDKDDGVDFENLDKNQMEEDELEGGSNEEDNRDYLLAAQLEAKDEKEHEERKKAYEVKKELLIKNNWRVTKSPSNTLGLNIGTDILEHYWW